ncbi:hypothetical protein FH972_015409 [Carpinus fangiana]|uniref:Uncharacterized protein n=1 Tax=Carpinus fangiana TaxID=176857 RepID=A0A5N6RCZ2_9ROSI|nr:hypothetical protein FH972_015409 [Carpinus fangiana]
MTQFFEGNSPVSVSEAASASWLPQRTGEVWPLRLTDVSRGVNRPDWRIPLYGPFGNEVSRVLGGGLVPGFMVFNSLVYEWHKFAKAFLFSTTSLVVSWHGPPWFVAMPMRSHGRGRLCCYAHNPIPDNWHALSLDFLPHPVRLVGPIGSLILVRPTNSTFLQLVICSLVLVGGDPGVGKSTLLLQDILAELQPLSPRVGSPRTPRGSSQGDRQLRGSLNQGTAGVTRKPNHDILEHDRKRRQIELKLVVTSTTTAGVNPDQQGKKEYL